jgi:hypothetical protein
MNTPSKLAIGWSLEATAHLPKNRRAHRRLALRYRARWQPWSRARMPWPIHLAIPVLARTRSTRRGVGGRNSSQRPPEAQRVAQMEVAGAQNLQTAACRRRKADPVGGRRRRGAGQWRASDERVADNDGRRAYGLRAPVIQALCSWQNFCANATVAVSLLFDKYCSIMI